MVPVEQATVRQPAATPRVPWLLAALERILHQPNSPALPTLVELTTGAAEASFEAVGEGLVVLVALALVASCDRLSFVLVGRYYFAALSIVPVDFGSVSNYQAALSSSTFVLLAPTATEKQLLAAELQ